MRLAALVVAASASMLGSAEAQAEWADETLAHFTRGAQTRGVQAYRLSGRRVFDHAILGQVRHRDAEAWTSRLLLLECDRRECRGTVVFLGLVDEHRVALIDLRGEPGELKRRTRPARRDAIRLDTRSMGWPALVVETVTEKEETAASRYGGEVTGVRRERRLSIVSLQPAHKARPRVLDRRSFYQGASGAGYARTYSIARPLEKRGIVDIIESNQRLLDRRSMCRRPPPTITRLHWNGDRFQERAPVGRSGC